MTGYVVVGFGPASRRQPYGVFHCPLCRLYKPQGQHTDRLKRGDFDEMHARVEAMEQHGDAKVANLARKT